ncbi:MAG: hypothetical protein O3B01_32310 [Planctomycetota bacterium]|nr:hypothetical protein [Planctomycetota bacterium]MDA1143266.1 hypothetical protein [Planctomycetota bacterium]
MNESGKNSATDMISVGLCVASVVGSLFTLTYAATTRTGIGITGDGQWSWRVIDNPQFYSLGFPLVLTGAMLLLLGYALFKVEKFTRKLEAGLVAGLFAGSFGLQVASAGMGPGGHVETLFASYPPANAYFNRATQVESLHQFLSGYKEQIEKGEFRVQLSTHPPGSIVFYIPFLKAAEFVPGLRSMFRWLAPPDAFEVREIQVAISTFILKPEHETAIWMGSFALRLLASLVVVALYLLLRTELQPKVALGATAVGTFLPALYLFNPHPDQLFPAITCLYLFFVYRGLRTRSWKFAAGAGLILFFGLFFSLSFLVPGFISALVWGLAIYRTRISEGSARQHLTILAGGVGGMLAPAIFLWLFFDHNILSVWQVCLENNDRFNAHSGRIYWKWFLFNPVELLIFAGAPLFCLFWFAWTRDLNRRWLGTEFPSDSSDLAIPSVTLLDIEMATGLTLILLNVCGKNLGEVGRLWMIVMPLMACGAGAIISEWYEYSRRAGGLMLLLVLVTLAHTIGLRLFVDAMGVFV